MKLCPFCKSELSDNARFCLYCMKVLNEKDSIKKKQPLKRWQLIIIAILLLCSFIFVSFFIMNNEEGEKKPQKSNTVQASSSNSEEVNLIDSVETGSNEASSEPKSDSKNSFSSKEAQSSAESDASSNATSSKTGGAQSNTSSSKTAETSGKPSGNSSVVSSSKIISSSEPPSSTPTSSSSTSSTSSEDSKKTEVTYLYRAAQVGDDFDSKAKILPDDIVITGVKNAAEDGVYNIPQKIDGKRVIAIMEFAFTGSEIRDTVKSVIIPSTIKTINTNAFISCLNMTDIYFCGDEIHCYTRSLPYDNDKYNKVFTIHCSAKCTNRTYKTYKSYITNYVLC